MSPDAAIERVRVLVVDDDEDDYMITRDLLSEIRGPAYHLDWLSDYDAALEAMGRGEHDVYLLDYRLGERDGLQLLKEAMAKGYRTPVILLTGQGDRDVDVEATKAGAMDYLVKGRIDSTLLERSIRYAIERHRVEMEREKLIRELEGALAEIRTVSGLLPICSSCKSIRDDRGYWNQLETYISQHSDAQFSHSLCPLCLEKFFPDQFLQILPQRREGRGREEQSSPSECDSDSARNPHGFAPP